MGRSRSVSLVMAYLIAISNIPPGHCLKFIKTKRKEAFPNKGFQFQMESFYKENKKRLKRTSVANSYTKYLDYAGRENDLKQLAVV